MNFKDEMKQKVAQIEIILDEYLPAQEGLQKTVLTAMNTTVKAGGKRLRPMLINETYQMFGGKGDIVKPFMAAIEMIHTYSLIHDDLPALDNDDYRRGQKTCHIVYGEDMAILAGDALLNYAYEVATKAFDLAEKDQIMNVVEAIKILASKPGIYGMIGGQVADVELEGTPLSMEQILFIHKNMINNDKTLKKRIKWPHNQIRVRESVMQGECISTSHIRCIQREPLISLGLSVC